MISPKQLFDILDRYNLQVEEHNRKQIGMSVRYPGYKPELREKIVFTVIWGSLVDMRNSDGSIVGAIKTFGE